MQVVVCSKNKILLILVLFINTTISFSSSAKADVKVEKIDKVLNWDDTDFYRDADINIQLAKKIKQERKRRVELKNKGYSNKDINRILKEEKEKNNLTTQNNGINQKQQHNGTDDNVEGVFGNEDDDEEEEEYVLVRKKKKNGKVINKKNKAYLIDKDNYNGDNIHQNNKTSTHQDGVKIISGNPSGDVKNINNKKTNKTQNNFNIVPEIPKLPSEMNALNQVSHTDNNINNKNQFAILAHRLGNLAKQNGDQDDIDIVQKMVEKNAFNYNENNINNRIYTYNTNNTLYKENNDVSNRNRKINKIKKPINKSNNKSSSRFYAYTRPDAKKIIDDMGKNNQKKQASQEIEDNDEIDITNYAKQATSYQQNDDVEVVKNKYTEGQLIAKQIGVPQPVFRTKKNYNTQISPQNISQVKYDKNNQHLEPTMFQSQIINDVFANLGGDNATEIARALINQVGKVDVVDTDGNSLLMHAVARKNQLLTSMLLSEGANPNLLNKDGFSPLHLASTNGDDTALYYLMMAGGDPNLRDNDGNTSLMYASMTCNKQTLQMMISMGADLTAVNFANKNQSVLDYAKMNTNHPDVYQFLKEKLHQTKFVRSKDLNN